MKLDPPIMGLYVYNTNPVSQAPQTNKIVEGLKREDLFFVVHEHFVTDTAAYADIILPATMAGEHDDMMFSWGHFYFTINQKAIEPRGEAKSDERSSACSCQAMGFDDPQFKMSDMELAEHYVKWDAPQMAGSRHGLFPAARLFPSRRRHARRPRCRTPTATFPHPRARSSSPGQGRQELRRAAVPHDVRGRCNRARTSIRCPGTCRRARALKPIRASPKRYPLNIISPKSHGFLNSCYANEPHKIKGQGEQFVMVSPKDAAKRNHPRRRSRARLQRARRLRGSRARHRRRARRASSSQRSATGARSTAPTDPSTASPRMPGAAWGAPPPNPHPRGNLTGEIARPRASSVVAESEKRGAAAVLLKVHQRSGHPSPSGVIGERKARERYGNSHPTLTVRRMTSKNWAWPA